MHNNPLFDFRPCRYVNDPAVIARNDKMVSINSALTVDLTGQVCSDSLGFEFYSGVVVTRGDIHYVVTEYGVAYVHGKSIRERAMELVNISHPDFHEELLAKAKGQGYIYQDQTLPAVLYPREYENYWTDRKGTSVFFRPVKATDERAI